MEPLKPGIKSVTLTLAHYREMLAMARRADAELLAVSPSDVCGEDAGQSRRYISNIARGASALGDTVTRTIDRAGNETVTLEVLAIPEAELEIMADDPSGLDEWTNTRSYYTPIQPHRGAVWYALCALMLLPVVGCVVFAVLSLSAYVVQA